MTKKDYELIARAFHDVLVQDVNAVDRFTVEVCIWQVARALRRDNFRFDDQRFYAACVKGT
jgi:hypothetical protein